MGNRNKKIVRLNGREAGMMDQAVKDICDVSEEVTNQLEMKRGMMQNVLDIAQEGFERTGVSVSLRLAEDGYAFLFSDMQDYISSQDDEDEEDESPFGMNLDDILADDDFDDDDEDELDLPIEMFGGTDEEGREYSVLVMLMDNGEEDSFDLNIAIIRSNGEGEEILTDDGWTVPNLFDA